MKHLLQVAVLLFGFSEASAEERSATYDGIPMSVAADPEGVEIRYSDSPPPSLRETGVLPGSLLVKGIWENKILIGEAFVFSKGCPAIPYPIRGLIDLGRDLVVLGQIPTVIANCQASEYKWTDGSVMRFEPARREAKPETPSPKRKEAKPKPKSKPKPQIARPRPVQPQYNWREWNWRF